MKHNLLKSVIISVILLMGVSNAWGATQRYIYVGISNNYQNHKDDNNFGLNVWGGTSGGVKSLTWIQDNYNWDGRNYTIYRAQVYDDNNKAQFKGNKDWWDPGDGFSVTLNGTTKNAIFFSHSSDGWQGQFQQNYQVTSNASLAANKTNVLVGENVTLTPSLSSNATYNEIKSTTYEVSTNPNSGGSVSSAGEFSATKAGTYTVTATVTYNPKYFTGITKTATATQTIKVYDTQYVLLGSQTANDNLKGGMAGWDATNNNAYSSATINGTTMTIVANLTNAKTQYKFKIYNNFDGSYYGQTGTSEIPDNTSWTLNGSNDVLFTTTAAGSYTFVYNTSDNSIKVQYPAAYTVTYSCVPTAAANAPTTSPSISSGDYVLANTPVTFNAKAANTGYTWKGWAGTGSALSSNQSYTRSITANTTVYACYDLESYTITYNLNGGSGTMTPTSYNIETETFTLSTPSKTGYTFSGWYTKSDFSDAKVTQIAKGSTGDKNFYAKWTAHKYKVIFKVNGGSGTMKEQSFTYDVEQALTKNEFTRNGYTFASWNENASGNSTSYTDQQVVKNLTPTKDGQKTLYAQWTPNTYTVHFDGNGSTSGSMSDQGFTYDKEQTLSKNNFSKEGCIFTGWNTAADGSGTSYTDQKSVSNLVTEGTITLYAQWSTANCKWLETDIANIESGDVVIITMSKGTKTWTLQNAKNTGSAPEAIEIQENIKGDHLNINHDSYSWIANKNETILTFESTRQPLHYLYSNSGDDGVRVGNENNAKTNQSFKILGKYLLNIQTNRFFGVSLSANSWRCYTDTTGVIAYQTLKFYKKVCLDENNYWVTWDAGEGQFEDGKSTKIEYYQVGAEITPPTPTRTGYNLTWSPTPEDNMPEENVEYTAQWTLKTTNITLSPQGGTDGTESVKATYSQNMLEITPPKRTGYDFQGYFSSNGGTGTKYYNADGTSATSWDHEAETFTLIAYWKAKTTTVSFDQNGGDGGQTSAVPATYDKAMPAVAIPTRVGHTFLGYFDAASEGTKYYNADGSSAKNWDKEVAEITLYAQWQVNQYTVTWNPDGGHWDGDHNTKVETYEYGAEIVKPANPEKTGYAFIGWQPEVEEIMQNSNLTYTAQWGEEFCKNYSFHWGSGTEEQVRNDNHQACFTQKDDTHEWQVKHFTIPEDTKYFVGLYGWWYWSDLGVGDSNGQKSKSVMKEWTWTGDQVMYLAHVGRGYTLGHAIGAVGTLRIYDNTSLDNLDVAFIPNGYGITLTSISSGAKTPYAFRTTTVEHKWETEVLKLPGITNNKYTVGLATQVDGEYVESHHSETKNLEKIGITEVVEGKKVVYFKPDPWNSDNAVFAVWDGTNSKWGDDTNKLLTDTDNDGVYQGYVSSTCEKINFVRLSNGTTATNIDWNREWNQTNDISLATDKVARVYTITGWNETDYTETNASPKTGTNGKFRMWDNSINKNWFVHFVPYYLLSYDANGGESDMPATEYNTEDPNKEVTVSANGFTRTGYDFVEWNTKADGKDTSYQPGEAYTMTGDATLYAIWKAQAYTITYKDQGDEDYSGSNEAKLPKTHTYDKATELVNGEKIGYTFEGWYDNPDCTGDAITKLDAKGYTADITLYAKWTFAMEYTITNTETIFITSAVEQNIKATQPLILKVSNMPVGTTIDLSAGEHIHFYYANEEIKKLTNKYVDETFELEIVYKPEVPNTKEQPSITLNVLEHEKVIADLISCRSLPTTFAIVAKVGSMWYALPSQGLNSTDALIGYPVEVDNIADPTAVTAVPENADWSLRQVYAASHSDALKDRFKQYGANIMFENNSSPAKMLNASVSDNYLLTNAEYDNYKQSDNQGLYEWTPTTTDLETYTLTNAQRTDRTLNVATNTVFGVHSDNKATTEVRFLPIQNRYTPAALQVVEWKENSVVIMYNGDPTQTAQTFINGTNVGSVTLANVQKDIAVYELPADGLGTKPNQTLSVSIGSEKLLLPTPYMVNSEVTDEVLLGSSLNVQARRDIAKVSNLVILKGGKLTSIGAKTNPYTFRDVTIYGGGTLVVSADKGFGANTLTMRVGGVEDGNYKNLYPQLQLKGTLTNTSGQINLDYLTTNEFYYPLSVPYLVTIADIQYPVEIYGANVKSNNTGSFQFKYYDGAERAAGRTGWIVLDESQNSTLNPNTGYAIWGIPKKINGTRQKFGIHRLPLKQTAADMMISEKASHEATVKVYNGSKRESDNGWNYLGNPFLSHYGDFTTDADVMKLGKLVWDEEQSAWVVTDEYQRYVVFTNDCQNYTAELANATVIPAFSAFFIQADQGGVINFASPNVAAVQSLAARRTEEENKEITTGIILSGEKHSDRTGLLIADQFTEAYEFNADLSKFDNQDINLYTISPNGKLAFMAINEELAKQTIPLGYSVSADGMYTIAFDEQRYSRDDIYALYLIDYDRNETTNLLHMDYDFYSETGANVERFALQVAFAPSTTTDVEYTQVGDILVSREGNTLRLDNLPSDATVTIYDAVGHLIEQRIASQLLQLTLQKGYYLIHIGSNQNSVVIDTFIP